MGVVAPLTEDFTLKYSSFNSFLFPSDHLIYFILLFQVFLVYQYIFLNKKCSKTMYDMHSRKYLEDFGISTSSIFC